jgi:hypothetical protein
VSVSVISSSLWTGPTTRFQVSNVTIEAGDADAGFVSFGDARAGGSRKYTLKFTAVQDTVGGSLWDKVWSAAGSTVPFVISPNGGTAAAIATPTFTGNAVISEPNGTILGGEADASATAVQTIEAEWTCTAKPVRHTS